MAIEGFLGAIIYYGGLAGSLLLVLLGVFFLFSKANKKRGAAPLLIGLALAVFLMLTYSKLSSDSEIKCNSDTNVCERVTSFRVCIRTSGVPGVYSCFLTGYCPCPGISIPFKSTQNIGPEEASRQIDSILGRLCNQWINPLETNPNPQKAEPIGSERTTITNEARKAGWLLSDKDPTTKQYVEPGPFSGCDCMVFLSSKAGFGLLSPEKARKLFAEASSDSTYAPSACNEKAACMVRRFLPELADLSGFKACPY